MQFPFLLTFLLPHAFKILQWLRCCFGFSSPLCLCVILSSWCPLIPPRRFFIRTTFDHPWWILAKALILLATKWCKLSKRLTEKVMPVWMSLCLRLTLRKLWMKGVVFLLQIIFLLPLLRLLHLLWMGVLFPSLWVLVISFPVEPLIVSLFAFFLCDGTRVDMSNKGSLSQT